MRYVLAVLILMGAFHRPAAAQLAPEMLRLSGPRVGVTFLSGEAAVRAEEDFGVSSAITQFGWQWEKQFFSTEAGIAAVTEWVALAGGLEQGMFLPSLSWLVGLRTAGGAELGVGPNISGAGVGLALASGITLRVGEINFPVNLAVVPSEGGMRVSLLAGFNMRQ